MLGIAEILTFAGVPDILKILKKKLLLFFLILLVYSAAAGAEETVSVLYFESLDRTEEFLWMEKGIADTLISELSGADGLVIVEREQLQRVIKEMALSLSGLTDEAGAPEIGRLLNAEKLIYGSYSSLQGLLRINCRAVETSTGKIVFSLSEEGPLKDFSLLNRRLAGKIRQGLGFPINGSSILTEDPNLAALSLYYRGLDLFDREEYSGAVLLLEESLKEAPGFGKPGRALEECYRFLQDFRKARQLRELNGLKHELDQLFRRLERQPFTTYAEIISRAASEGRDIAELNERLKKDISWFRGDTPAQVLWNAQIVMFRIAQKLQSEFNDPAGSEAFYSRIIRSARRAGELYPADNFLPEIFYQELLAWYMLKDWKRLEENCFAFMNRWPDFRMITSVEDFYEKALENRE